MVWPSVQEARGSSTPARSRCDSGILSNAMSPSRRATRPALRRGSHPGFLSAAVGLRAWGSAGPPTETKLPDRTTLFDSIPAFSRPHRVVYFAADPYSGSCRGASVASVSVVIKGASRRIQVGLRSLRGRGRRAGAKREAENARQGEEHNLHRRSPDRAGIALGLISPMWFSVGSLAPVGAMGGRYQTYRVVHRTRSSTSPPVALSRIHLRCVPRSYRLQIVPSYSWPKEVFQLAGCHQPNARTGQISGQLFYLGLRPQDDALPAYAYQSGVSFVPVDVAPVVSPEPSSRCETLQSVRAV